MLAMLCVVIAGWAGWQYSRRQAVDSESLGDYRADGRAITLLLVEPDVSLNLDAGLRRDSTARLARALDRRLADLGYRTQALSARSDEERFGLTAQTSARTAAIQHQARTAQTIREVGAPVLRVSLDGMKRDGREIAEQAYRIELLDPQTLQPAWRATLTWREGRYQSLALLWHLRHNRLPPPLWDSLADLAMARMREDGVIRAEALIQ
ncbi:hypothetical protein LA76x_4320 [Lysobacter antibioticus]|uniref:Uncharacterized protein n=1 Tax=Lysobacter antibioticus TaxID=84531 RepID=A0A0S2FFW3_LYSAN|nr:hypothetical protein LA76x_4320 [Lysobacter antibioticus]